MNGLAVIEITCGKFVVIGNEVPQASVPIRETMLGFYTTLMSSQPVVVAHLVHIRWTNGMRSNASINFLAPVVVSG